MAHGPRTCAVILAGGRGQRAGRAKQFVRVGGHSLLYHACLPFAECREVGGVVVVVPPRRRARVARELTAAGLPKLLAVVAGGATRHLSARAGLRALPSSCSRVLIHDAARPFVTGALIRRVVRAIRQHGAAIPVLDVADSVIEVGRAGAVTRYLPRGRLRAVQTPQGFDLRTLREAFARSRHADATDDASVVQRAGGRVVTVAGDPANVKITTLEQLTEAVDRLEGAR